MTERIGDWIQTVTGKQYWPLDPRPEEVDVVDIAHHLSQLCRFGGACREFYSVAEHCVRVSLVVPPRLAPAALFHDAAEAYLIDVPRPIKIDSEFSFYRQVELSNEVSICHRLALPDDAFRDPEIKRADNVLLITEARDLWGKAQAANPSVAPLPGEIVPLSYREAHAAFLRRYIELFGDDRDLHDLWRVTRRGRIPDVEISK